MLTQSTKKQQPTRQVINLNEESPSPKIVDFQGINETANKPLNRSISSILTLEDITKAALEISKGDNSLGLSIYRLGKLSRGKTKTHRLRVKPTYRDILDFIREDIFIDKTKLPEDPFPDLPKYKSIYEIYNHFPEIKPRTLRSYLKELQQLKWVRRHGRDYHLNPFLFELFRDRRNTAILEFASFKIDLFDLLNIPLISALDKKVMNVSLRYFVVDKKYYREIFNGLMGISFTFEDGGKAETILPVNLHAQYAKGRDINHYCIPLVWKLFDIEKASYYSTDFKRSHHKGIVNKHNEFIHFDNSITIRYQPKGQLYLLWEKKFRQQKTTSMKHWQTGEYLEYDNLENLKRLLIERFIKGERFLNLFKALGMTYKPNAGRPKGSKNKSKLKFFTPRQVNLMTMLAKERFAVTEQIKR